MQKSEKYLIRSKYSLLGDKFIVRNVLSNKEYSARKTFYLNLNVKVFHGPDFKELYFQLKQRNSFFNRSHDLEDSSGIVFAKINIINMDWVITDLVVDKVYKVQVDTNSKQITLSPNITSFKIMNDDKKAAEFKYVDLNTTELNFYDQENFALDRRLGIAFALYINI